MENGTVLVRCRAEALGTVLLIMRERGFSTYYTYLVIDDEVFIHITQGILTSVITWGSAGEKLYSRPSQLTEEGKTIVELDADSAAESTGLRPLYKKDSYEGSTLQSLIFGT